MNVLRSGFARSAVFHGQLVVGHPDTRFCKGGDSGAIIWSDAREPLALLFAASEGRASWGETSYMGLTYANPLDVVLDSLGVTLATG